MGTYLATVALIFGIGLLGIAVQRLYEGFARRHPELGPFREQGKCGSCSGGCGGGGEADSCGRAGPEGGR